MKVPLSLTLMVLALAMCAPPGVITCPTAEPCPACPTAPACPELPTAAPTQEPTPTATPTAVPTPAPTPNLLVNPGFEEGTYRASADLVIPVGWRVWSDCANTIHSETEAHPPHVHGGTWAARLWQSWQTCDMVLYQQLAATPGAAYQFMAYGFSWSTSNPVVGTPSEAYVKAWAGIDPQGGSDPLAGSIVWGNENAARDKYGDFGVIAQATGEHVTVFLRSRPDWGLARSDTFWDDTALYEIAEPGELPTAAPTVAEATPLGGDPVIAAGDKMEDLRGSYTPDGVQNVRTCAVAGPGCNILRALAAGVPVSVYGRITVYPSGDVWLCLDGPTNAYGDTVGSQCGELAAYRIGSRVFGELVISKEN